jgi:transcription factor 7-like 2
MPHVSSSGGGDDLGSEDEVKVFKDEGEEEKRSSENLTEDKSDLIDLTESEVRRTLSLSVPSLSPPCPCKPSQAGKVRIFKCVRFPVLQEKGSLAGGSYAATGKASTRSDLSPVFGE